MNTIKPAESSDVELENLDPCDIEIMRLTSELKMERERSECADALMDVLQKLGTYLSKPTRPTLTVWYGKMPESNGKENWTAILKRVDSGIHDGITIARSEYPDRVRYEADRVRYLIGEISTRPYILDYDANLRSDYVYPPEDQKKLLELPEKINVLWRDSFNSNYYTVNAYRAEDIEKMIAETGIKVKS